MGLLFYLQYLRTVNEFLFKMREEIKIDDQGGVKIFYYDLCNSLKNNLSAYLLKDF